MEDERIMKVIKAHERHVHHGKLISGIGTERGFL